MTGWLGHLREAVLPLPDRQDLDAVARQEATDVAIIEATDWTKFVDVALAEAIRITADETARRQGADTKSSTYLVVVAALIPIIAAIQVAVWEGKAGPAPRWVSLGAAELATVFIAFSGFWALRALKVAVIDRVDVEDVAAAWRRRDPRVELVKRMLAGARRTRSAIDLKLSRMLLAQDYLFRGFVMLVALLLLNAGWYFADLVLPDGRGTAAVTCAPVRQVHAAATAARQYTRASNARGDSTKPIKAPTELRPIHEQPMTEKIPAHPRRREPPPG